MTAPAAVLLNPLAGTAATGDLLSRLLRENGVDAEIVMVSQGVDIIGLAKKLLNDGSRTLVAGGGDGTVSSVASVVARAGATLGVLPLGTLNHFAKDMRLPLDLEGAVRNLRTGVEQMVDIAEVNGRLFINNSGLGLYPSMVKQREKRRRHGQRKWIAFFHASVATLRRFPFLQVRLVVDDDVFAISTPFVFVGNNKYRMEGFELGSRESLAGGKLFIGVAQKQIGRWGLVRLGFRALLGRIRNERDFAVFCTHEVGINSRHRRLPVSMDGEVRLIETPLIYKICPRALRVIAPAPL